MVDEFGTDMMFLTRTKKQAGGIARSLERAGVLYETQSTMDIDGWGARDGMSERTALYNALQRLDGVELPGHGLNRDWGDDLKTPEDVVLPSKEAATLLDHTNHNYLDDTRTNTTDAAQSILAEGVTVTGDDLREHVTGKFWSMYSRADGSVGHLNTTANLDEGDDLDDKDIEALETALDRNDDPVRSVDTRVYTIHASKGSEAKNVAVYDGVTATINDKVEVDRDARRNEYRTWYVALTRASEDLFVLRGGFDWTYQFLPQTLLDSARQAHEAVADGGIDE
jgi:DNA helicase-2/ATP-dependent DNA helicase PcrA